jgi:ribosomal protein S27AE
VNFPLDRTGNSWIDKDKIRIAEYFRKAAKRDTLVNHPMRGPMLLSDLPEGAEKEARGQPDVQKRDVVVPEITWYKIAGNKVIDKKPWPGRYIPLVRVVGEERFIDGKIERKGHTRNLKDAQRMYNYMSSANVEFIALQTKTPFIAAAEAIEGYESEWSRANLDNLPYLPYNAFDEQGNPIQKPQRENTACGRCGLPDRYADRAAGTDDGLGPVSGAI